MGDPGAGDGSGSPPIARSGLIGKHVGNYVISRTLGQGGMGEVVAADHPALGRTVAIKFLSRRLSADPTIAVRFLSEARTMANLRHPNIVDIFDFGELDGRPYYVMELLEGADLEAVMAARGRFAPQQAEPYVKQICAALEAAHRQNVVHRDLKPANIFVLGGEPPRIKLMDFGIAKILTADAAAKGRTGTGQVLGTPSHMAPEQALGDGEKICAQTDLYSLGVILYQMLAGRPLFDHPSPVMLMLMHVQEPFVPLRAIVPNLPEKLAEVVEHCLQKAPENRPASASIVAERFLAASLLADQPSPSLAGIRLVGPIPAPDIHESTTVDSPAAPAPLISAPKLAPQAGPPALPNSAQIHAEALSPTLPRHPARSPLAASDAPPPSPFPAPPRLPPLPPSPVEPPDSSPALDQPTPPPPRPSPSTEPKNLAPPDVFTERERVAVTKILTRMQKAGDFPAFVKNVSEINSKADVDGDFSAGQLGDAILRDYALTAKLLRVVNSSFYNRFPKKINNVSRAVVVLGFEQIRSLALGISIFRNPKKKTHAQELAELSVSSLVSGEIARAIAKAAGLRDAEEAMVCAMFKNLGLHLVIYYLPELYDEIRKKATEEGLTIDEAAERLMGVTLWKLGIGVVLKWRLSQRIVGTMVPGTVVDIRPQTDDERLRLVSAFANELCETLTNTPADRRELAMTELATRYRMSVRLQPAQLTALLGTVQKSFKERYSSLLGLNPKHSKLFRNLGDLVSQSGVDSSKPSESPSSPGSQPSIPVRGHSIRPSAAPSRRSGRPSIRPVSLSTPPRPETVPKHIESLAARLNGRHDPESVLRAILDVFVRGLGFRRMIAFMPDKARANLVVRGAVGEDHLTIADDLLVPLRSVGAGDVFSAAYQSGKDVIVPDAFDPQTTKRVPRIYYEIVGSPAFALYPCAGRTTLLLLGDVDDPERLPAGDNLKHVVRLKELAGRLLLSAPRERVMKRFMPRRV